MAENEAPAAAVSAQSQAQPDGTAATAAQPEGQPRLVRYQVNGQEVEVSEKVLPLLDEEKRQREALYQRGIDAATARAREAEARVQSMGPSAESVPIPDPFADPANWTKHIIGEVTKNVKGTLTDYDQSQKQAQGWNAFVEGWWANNPALKPYQVAFNAIYDQNRAQFSQLGYTPDRAFNRVKEIVQTMILSGRTTTSPTNQDAVESGALNQRPGGGAPAAAGASPAHGGTLIDSVKARQVSSPAFRAAG